LFKCLGDNSYEDCPFATVPEGSLVVCTVTGHGLKDSEIILQADMPIMKAGANKAQILHQLGF